MRVEGLGRRIRWVSFLFGRGMRGVCSELPMSKGVGLGLEFTRVSMYVFKILVAVCCLQDIQPTVHVQQQHVSQGPALKLLSPEKARSCRCAK